MKVSKGLCPYVRNSPGNFPWRSGTHSFPSLYYVFSICPCPLGPARLFLFWRGRSDNLFVHINWLEPERTRLFSVRSGAMSFPSLFYVFYFWVCPLIGPSFFRHRLDVGSGAWSIFDFLTFWHSLSPEWRAIAMRRSLFWLWASDLKTNLAFIINTKKYWQGGVQFIYLFSDSLAFRKHI